MAYYTKYNNKWYEVNLNAIDSTKYPSSASSDARPCSTTAYSTGISQASGFYSGTSVIYTKLAHTITLSKNTHVKSVSLTYVDIDGNTLTVTTAGTYYAKPGSNYSWSSIADDYCYITANGNGNATVNGDKTISPTADYGYYKVSLSAITNATPQVNTSQSNYQNSVVAKYNSTIYIQVKPNNYYFYTLNNNKYTQGSPYTVSYTLNASNFTISATTPGTSSSISTPTATKSIGGSCTAGYYYVTLTSSNGTIKWGTASNPTASSGIVVQYGSTIHYTIKPNNYYVYGSTTSGSTTSDASVTVNSSNFTFSSVSPGTSSSGITAPTATKAYDCTAGYYNITLSCTNGTIKYGTTSSPTGTTTIKVQYNGTVYYQITPYSGYKYDTTIGPSSTGVYSASLSSLGVPTTAGTNSSPAPFSKPYSCTAVSGMTLTLSNNTYKGTIRIRSGSASGPLIATWDASVESSYNFTNGTEGTTYYINGEEYRNGLFVYWITTTTFTYTSGGSQTFTVHSQKDISDICPNEACTSKEGRN